MPLNHVLRQRTHWVASSLNSHRVLLYTLFSLAAVSAVIANALKNYSNFYSVAISLSKSSRSVLVLANFGFLLALLSGHVVQRLFFGALRPNEVERLYDRLWFFITESLLAFTIFRDEFDIPFALMFGFLLFVKSFHWLAGDRIEWMDQRPYPGPSLLFHFRMSTLFIILWTTDFLMFVIAVENTMTHGVGGMVLFASEYGILMASVVNTISKYLLSAYELRRAGQRGGENAPPWENKSMWVFYIELTTDFLKLTTYLVFFTIIITFYGLPLNIVRDVYITARSFISRLRALHRYQAATRNMDQRYPNATQEEMTAMSDRTCIICREEMVLNEAGEAPANADGPNTTPKKLPCGHIFHFHCLRSWLERQQSCPTCRRTVLDVSSSGQTAGVPVVPGGAAQPPNGVGPGIQNQNPQRINNPLGNPLGLLGRLFGPPAQPPINPGQLAQALPVQNQNGAPQIPGNIGGGQVPQGVVIQYHIQYQVPRDAQQNVPRTLQPAPQFPGFPGPGGVWQPWPPAQDVPDVIPPTSPVANGSTQDPMEPTSTSTTPDTAEAPGEPNGSSNSVDDPGAPTTPREAAALAALRRLNGTSSRPTRSRSPSPTDTPMNGTSGIADPSASSSTHNAASSDARPPSIPSHTERSGIPALIPLYDYSALSVDNPGPLHPQPNNTTHTLQVPGAETTQPRRDSTHSSQGSTNSRHRQPRNPHILSSQLPPTLTDEQLAIMDRITREAIDERLRVLEGVSGAVYRCIDDLMRMRSTLPSPTVPAHPTPSAHLANPEVSSSTSNEHPLTNGHTSSPVASTSGSGSSKMGDSIPGEVEPEQAESELVNMPAENGENIVNP
ncbi:hypothetical protein BDZ94DRAFT_1318695 [Collybia nuda]|uniref:RING-type E3 ubiquitin transferase n=1 Tax=Collybia nuda TaxID=64659 RepID=A0A9P6CNR9_9AGAR|nr:hypothetical protein BDZ94DRAFT_1318695 [Collybia nuda]